METKPITPEMKEQFRTIFLDARESSTSRNKRALELNNKMDNVRLDIMGYRDALSTTCDLVYRLSEFSCLIASSLSENLISSKKDGCLTERKITASFDLMKILIDLAYSKEDIDALSSHYHNKVSLINSVDVDKLNEYVEAVFKD